MSKLIGTDPNQVPSNADLGTLAYVDSDQAGEITVSYLTAKSYTGTPTQIEISPSGQDARIVATNGIGGLGRIHWDAGGGGRWEFRTGAVDANTGIADTPSTRLEIYHDGQIALQNNAELRIGYDGTQVLNANGTFQDTQTRQSTRPNFNIDFLNTKELHPRMSFYRQSVGTYYDETGTLRYADHNEPRFNHDPATGEAKGILIEEDRLNVVSSDIRFTGGQWGQASGFDMSRYEWAGRSPDGKWNATKLVPGNSNTRHGIYSTGLTAASGWQTFSVYAKAAGYNRLIMSQIYGANSSGYGVVFNLNTGTYADVTTPSVTKTESMEYVGDGWYRCSVSFDNTNGTNYANLFVGEEGVINTYDPFWRTSTGTGDNENGILIWGAQYERDSKFASSYIPSQKRFQTRGSTATFFDKEGVMRIAPVNTPRYGHKYDGRKWVPTGLLVEAPATNIIPNSEEHIDGQSHLAGLATASSRSVVDFDSETTTAPDGSTVGVMRGTGASGGLYHYPDESITAGTQYTFSTFVRKPTTNNGYTPRTFVMYTHTGRFPSYSYSAYDFDSKTFTTKATESHVNSYGAEDYGNGWVRLWLSGTPDTSGGTFHFVCYFSDQTSTQSTHALTNTIPTGQRVGYIWGSQLEVGREPTSYIPTQNISLTRAGDDVNYQTVTRDDDILEIRDCDDLIGQITGTVFTEWDTNEPSDGFGGVFELSDGGSGTNGIDQRFAQYYISNNNAVSYGGTFAPKTNYKTALAYDLTSVLDSVTARNGVQGSSNTVHQWNMHLNKIRLGSIDLNPAYQLNGHLRAFRLYPERMEAAEIVALTEND